MSESALDKFGKVLMTRVRDEAIIDWDMIISGQMKDRGAQKIATQYASLSPDTKTLISRIIPQIVDTTLHHLLWTLEQDDSIDVAIHGGSGQKTNVKDESDGLSGDLYDWLRRFSTQRHQDPSMPSPPTRT